jgi:hypothetical protein
MTPDPTAPSCPVREIVARGSLEKLPDGGSACSVHEVARLHDGREIALSDDRGWSSSASWDAITLDHIVRNVYTSVLPDDAEVTAEEHDWTGYEKRLVQAGVDVAADSLRHVPYHLELIIGGR